MELTNKQITWALVLVFLILGYISLRLTCSKALRIEGMTPDLDRLNELVYHNSSDIVNFLEKGILGSPDDSYTFNSNIRINGTLETTGNATLNNAVVGSYNNSTDTWAMFTHKERIGGDKYGLLIGKHGGNVINATNKMGSTHGDAGYTQIRLNDSKKGSSHTSLHVYDLVEANTFRADSRVFVVNRNNSSKKGSIMGPHGFYVHGKDGKDISRLHGGTVSAENVSTRDAYVAEDLRGDYIYVQQALKIRPSGVGGADLGDYVRVFDTGISKGYANKNT